MATGRKAKKVQTKIQALVFGEQFTGKSTMALQMAYLKNEDGSPMKLLILDAENGSVDDYLGELEQDGIDLDNIYIIYTQSLNEVNEYIKLVTDNKDFYELDENGKKTNNIVLDAEGKPFRADAIIVDGTSVLNLATKQGLVEFSKKRAKVKAERDEAVGDEKFVRIEGAGIELKDYNTLGFKGQDLVLSLTGCGKHYVITSRQTDEKVQVKDSKGQISSIATGKKIPEGFKQMGYNVKTEIRLYRDEDDYDVVKAHVIKDRTGVLPIGIIEDPSLLPFQEAINNSKNNEKHTVKNKLHESVKNELKATEKEILGIVDKDSEGETRTEDVSVLMSQLKQKWSKLTVGQKQEMQVKFKEAGLPQPSKITDLEQAKKALELLA